MPAAAAAALAAAAATGARASFVVEHGTLHVMFPPFAQASYNISLANFGVPLYGGELRARVVYPPTNRDGCVPFTDFSAAAGADPGESSLLMIDRGGCSFGLKALHVQQTNASAMIVADNLNETLITMDVGSDDESQRIARQVRIPAGLVQWRAGHTIEQLIQSGFKVIVSLDWSDVVPAPDELVEWEMWSNSDDNCGLKCDRQKAFIKAFAPHAKMLEQGGFTQFTPHYITWNCPEGYEDDDFCKSQCINHGRYCCPDPEDDLENGYDGRDVIQENLRQLCFFQQVNRTGHPWYWWDYVTKFGDRCSMASGNYDVACAESVAVETPGVDIAELRACVGDPNQDSVNPILEYEKWSQVSDDRRGDISIMPTIIANGVQFRGKFDETAIMRFLCNAFSSCLLPDVCDDLVDRNEHACASGCNGQVMCAANLGDGRTACTETMQDPGFTCVCPPGKEEVVVDGKRTCHDTNECATVALGIAKCQCDRCLCHNLEPVKEDDPGYECYEEPPSPCDAADNGGCWMGGGFSACVDNLDAKKKLGREGGDPHSLPSHLCMCPRGFEGDGVTGCEDRWCAKLCSGDGQVCGRAKGSANYTCSCARDFSEQTDGTCVRLAGAGSSSGGFGLGAWVGVVVASVCAVGAIGYGLYKWRLRSYMDQEIRQIMSQYMPLDKEGFDDDAAPIAPNLAPSDDQA